MFFLTTSDMLFCRKRSALDSWMPFIFVNSLSTGWPGKDGRQKIFGVTHGITTEQSATNWVLRIKEIA